MRELEGKIANFLSGLQDYEVPSTSVYLGGAKPDTAEPFTTKNDGDCMNTSFSGCDKSTNRGKCVNQQYTCDHSTNGSCNNGYLPPVLDNKGCVVG